ncbi:MAG: hypothetical protein V7K76_14490 [Nostoc sp.]|uniref:hypothetical protein n=1 Tax=Nostoc sp. TaxID=1180 RepID=UPI002FF4C0E4
MTNYKGIPPEDLMWAVKHFSHCALKLYNYGWAVHPYKPKYDKYSSSSVKKEIVLSDSGIKATHLNKAIAEVTDSKLFKIFYLPNKPCYEEYAGTVCFSENKHGIYLPEPKEYNFSAYNEFLSSEYWQDCRRLVLARDNFRCVKCGANQKLQVHHLTYEHHGSEMEHLADLTTLCCRCHTSTHKGGVK